MKIIISSPGSEVGSRTLGFQLMWGEIMFMIKLESVTTRSLQINYAGHAEGVEGLSMHCPF